MRDFINWDILQRIENSPKEYIVQRKVSLLDAFLMGYEFCLQVENEEQLKIKYESMPSLEEYARKKYNADNIGSRNAINVIAFTCEDERDFFYKYFDFLREYEQEYPILETISYTLRKFDLKDVKPEEKHDTYHDLTQIPPKPTFRQMLSGMRRRYCMYFGYYDLADFRAFLNGYFVCKKDYNQTIDDFEVKVKTFTEKIRCETVNVNGDFVTWDRLYRYDRDWRAWGPIAENGEKMIEDFWEDMEAFIGEALDL